MKKLILAIALLMMSTSFCMAAYTNVTPVANGGTGQKSLVLLKLRRAIAKADLTNSVDGAVASTLPTVTNTYDASLSNFFLLDSLETGGIKYFNLLGGRPKDAGTVSGAIHGWYVEDSSYNGTTYSSPAVLEFISDAPKLQIRGAQGTWRIEVNGQSISKTGNATAASGGEQQIVLDWSSVRAVRTYRIHISGAAFISRVGVGANSRIWAPSTDDYVRVGWVGDSYTQGTGASYGDNNYADVASALLGFKDSWHSAFGGTGYLNAGSYVTFRGHIADIIAANPDIIVVAGGTNDANAGATLQAEVLLYLQTLRASLPNTPIVVLGPWPKATGPNATILGVEASISAAVTQFADPLCKFAPVAADAAGAWISGTGYQGATNASGNSDYYIWTDGTHPNDAGHDYLGRATAQAIRNAINSIQP